MLTRGCESPISFCCLAYVITGAGVRFSVWYVTRPKKHHAVTKEWICLTRSVSERPTKMMLRSESTMALKEIVWTFHSDGLSHF